MLYRLIVMLIRHLLIVIFAAKNPWSTDDAFQKLGILQYRFVNQVQLVSIT